MRKVIGIGETVLDIIFRNDQPLRAVPGGSTFNAIISIGRTGTPCLMATEVGDDRVGDIVTRFLAANNVCTDYVFRAKGTQSHVSLAFLDENNDAQYLFYKNHAELTMHQSMPEVRPGDVILFGSYFAINPNLRGYVSTFLKTARAKGAILYYDINFRSSHIADLPRTSGFIEENMRLASVVRGSAEDFHYLYGKDNVDDVYESKIKPLCGTLIYTDAANPVQVCTPKHRLSFPVKPINTVSTIGAGDNFNAGFCYALLHEGIDNVAEMANLSVKQWSALVDYGQKFSSAVCQSMDNYIPVGFM